MSRRFGNILAHGSQADHDHVLTSPGIGSPAWFKDPDGTTPALYEPE